MSYVGEYGWEITCLSENAKPIYNALVEAGATPEAYMPKHPCALKKGSVPWGTSWMATPALLKRD